MSASIYPREYEPYEHPYWRDPDYLKVPLPTLHQPLGTFEEICPNYRYDPYPYYEPPQYDYIPTYIVMPSSFPQGEGDPWFVKICALIIAIWACAKTIFKSIFNRGDHTCHQQ